MTTRDELSTLMQATLRERLPPRAADKLAAFWAVVEDAILDAADTVIQNQRRLAFGHGFECGHEKGFAEGWTDGREAAGREKEQNGYSAGFRDGQVKLAETALTMLREQLGDDAAQQVLSAAFAVLPADDAPEPASDAPDAKTASEPVMVFDDLSDAERLHAAAATNAADLKTTN